MLPRICRSHVVAVRASTQHRCVERLHSGGSRYVTTRVPAAASRNSAGAADAGQDKLFVSSHYQFDEEIVPSFLSRNNVQFSSSADGKVLKLQECPFCPKDSGARFKLSVFRNNGSFSCAACGSKGSWFDFQRRLRESSSGSTSPLLNAKAATPAAKLSTQRALQKEVAAGNSKALPEQDKLTKHISNLPQLSDVLSHIKDMRNLNDETTAKYKVGGCVLRIKAADGSSTDHHCVSFPWVDVHKNGKEILLRIKSKSVTDETIQRLDPANGRSGFFGWHLVPKDAKSIIITESEWDAMAVYQQTGLPAVALPAGGNALPVELVNRLEPFEQIYLWMSDDVVGQESAKKWANKLGRERVYIVHTKGMKKDGPKTAIEAHQLGLDLKAILALAKPLPHESILTFTELHDEVYRELANPEQVAGIPSTTFPTLTKILKGHRRGELTVFTGPTGIGKTTILAQLSLDYLRQGVSTLWGSFEINNVRLAKKMITQFAEKSLEGEGNVSAFDSHADSFESLPLHFLRFHGNTGLDKVFDAMEYAVYIHDVEHIILDNLQFMMPTYLAKGFDKFDQLDMAIARIRKFASEKNIHITLIIHPRKEEEGQQLSISSIFGTAKATQEADNVIILQKGKSYRYIEVTKNRFCGDLGKVPFRFDPEALKFHELTTEEVEAAEAKAGAGAVGRGRGKKSMSSFELSESRPAEEIQAVRETAM